MVHSFLDHEQGRSVNSGVDTKPASGALRRPEGRSLYDRPYYGLFDDLPDAHAAQKAEWCR